MINDSEEDEEPVELPFRIFESTPTYGSLSNLMFSDATVRLQIIPQDEMSYKSYLGNLNYVSDMLFLSFSKVIFMLETPFINTFN